MNFKEKLIEKRGFQEPSFASKSHQELYEQYFDYLGNVVKDENSILDFMRFSGQVYKYSFEEALYAHGQNPNSTFLAEFDQWKKIGRYPKAGSKAMKIMSYENGKIIKKNVFDVRQTEGKKYTFPSWEFEPKLLDTTLQMMGEGKGKPLIKGNAEEKVKQVCEMYYQGSGKGGEDLAIKCSSYILLEKLGLKVEEKDTSFAKELVGNVDFVTLMTQVTAMNQKLLHDMNQIKNEVQHKIVGQETFQTEEPKEQVEPQPKPKQDISHSDSHKTLSELFSSSYVSVREVDELLRTGGNEKDSALRICSFYKKNHSLEENAVFLQQEYRTGGKGLRIGNLEVSAWFNEDGICVAFGDTALKSRNNVVMTWETAAERIQDLLDNGQYLPKEKMEVVDEHEIKETAAKLWYLYQDHKDGIPKEWREESHGFPSDVVKISRRLSQPDTLNEIVHKLEKDMEDKENNFPRRWLRPQEVFQRVIDLQKEPLSFPVNEDLHYNYEKFITQDEIDAVIKRGSGISEGKFRIYSYFSHEHSTKEKADFLKDECGTVGSSLTDGFVMNSTKGMEITRGRLGNGDDTVNLSWSEVAKRIDRLMADGEYLSKEETDFLPEYEKRMLARQIYLFYYKQPTEIKPYPAPELELPGFHTAENVIRPMLEEPEKVTKFSDSMKNIYEKVEEDDIQYPQMKKAYEQIRAFQNGTYTLFPKSLTSIEQPMYAQKDDSLQLSFFEEEKKEKKPAVQSTKEKEKLPAFNENLLSSVLKYDRFMPTKKNEIEAYFMNHSAEEDRSNFLKKSYNKDYSLIELGEKKQMVGYHVEKNGLYIWEGNFMTRSAGTLYAWNQIEEKVRDLIDTKEYIEKPLEEEQKTNNDVAMKKRMAHMQRGMER